MGLVIMSMYGSPLPILSKIADAQNLRVASRDAWLLYEADRLNNDSAAARILAKECDQSWRPLRDRIYKKLRRGDSSGPWWLVMLGRGVIGEDMASGRQYESNRVDSVAETIGEIINEAFLVLWDSNDDDDAEEALLWFMDNVGKSLEDTEK